MDDGAGERGPNGPSQMLCALGLRSHKGLGKHHVKDIGRLIQLRYLMERVSEELRTWQGGIFLVDSSRIYHDVR